jgi:5-oxoprolinase (ATP-hydrolysing)
MTIDVKWQFWIDRGGTFTDVIARKPDGTLSSHKYLSVNPDHYDDAAVHAMRDILKTSPNAPFPTEKVASIKMGTTVATNALLEREGAKTLLVITAGLKDALLIGQQHRENLFDLKPRRPEPLYHGVVEAKERIAPDGTILTPLNQADIKRDLIAAKAEGYESIAIVLVHGYRHSAHEKQIAQIAKETGFVQISQSHLTSPLIKLVPRGDTTVADAYLSPLLRQYVGTISKATGGVPLYFMQSNGGLAAASAFEGKDSVLSGPAGGIVGAAKAAARENQTNIIGFDMGGTSTDVSHYAGTYERVFDTQVAGVRMTVPMMDIHTVAAGGGSICKFEDGRFQVGPQSAGAMPGPAAYGKGGPITVTDCNVILGKLQPDLFPQVFGANGDAPLDLEASRHGFQRIAQQISQSTGNSMSIEDIAQGFLTVAVEHMARAIKRVSVERGHNTNDYGLLTFGGAGGQHACLVADALGMTKVIVPPYAGLLSAMGIGLAEQRVIEEQSVEVPITLITDIDDAFEAVGTRAEKRLTEQGIAAKDQSHLKRARIKYHGTDTTLNVAYGSIQAMSEEFERAHQIQFGFIDQTTELVVASVEVEALSASAESTLELKANVSKMPREQARPVFYAGKSQDVKVLHRDALEIAAPIIGPAIVLENGGTTIVEPDWTLERTAQNSLILTRAAPRQFAAQNIDEADPILLEVFNNLFMSVAEEMGGVLAKTAHSVNVKERLDFSCAVFDASGNLIANAPHMPVHLGSMGESVIAILKARGTSLKPGDVFMVNDPSAGGTHLPDITVVTPVFLDKKPAPAFFVASRGHHADIGGISPGSMPSQSKTLEEEGICFTNFQIVSDGKFDEASVIEALNNHRFPARNPRQNIADLKAQIAANNRGATLVEKLVSYYGLKTVYAYMGFVRQNAAEAVRRVIDKISPGTSTYPMDCGATIKVSVIPDKKNRRLTIDFSGTSPQLASNYNAPFAVVKAAVLYVFRVLAGGDIPLNAGCLEPIDIKAEHGSMLKPNANAAVVAGNVETSQAITNALFLATNTLAAAQGTMNNLTFGNEQYQYYETIAGGTGAGIDFDGTSAIQSHMTNSRLTDVEILEWRYPVLVRQFGVRKNSGGTGAFKGGDGCEREIEFLEAMDVSLLANHYAEGPPGLKDGARGKAGRAFLKRKTGETVTLSSADDISVLPGDRLTIKTPGGGGYDLLD